MTLHYFECRVDHSAELYVVEGKHAANAVNSARNKKNQSVLAMQGKVPNVARRNLQHEMDRNVHVRRLTTILKSWASPLGPLNHRYSNVVILSDPDADGLHAAMLLACLLAEAFPQLVRQESLSLCRSPLFRWQADGEERVVYDVAEMNSLPLDGHHGLVQAQRFKGVASLPAELLRSACIDPQSRKASVLSETDCAAIKQRLV